MSPSTATSPSTLDGNGNATQNFWRSADNMHVPVRRVHPLGRGPGRPVPPDGHSGRPEPGPQGLTAGPAAATSPTAGSPAGPAVLAAAVVHPGQQLRQLSRTRSGTWSSRASWAPPPTASRPRRSPPSPRPRSPGTCRTSTSTRPVATRSSSRPPGRTPPGPGWAGPTPGTSIPLSQFFVADPAIRRHHQLCPGAGLQPALHPGVYNVSQTIDVNRASTMVLGLGFPTLIPQNGVNTM